MVKCKIIHILYVMFISLALFSCDSNKEIPEPEQPTEPKYHAGDSLACVKMYQEMHGETWLSAAIWDFKNIESWHGVQWSLIEEDGVKSYRVTDLNCEVQDGLAITLSEHIGALKYLTSLRLVGKGLVGHLSPGMNDFHLTFVVIGNTNLQGPLPDNLFNENTTTVQIVNNPNITGPLPSSITSLRGNKHPSRGFEIMNNGLTGKIPAITKAPVNLQSNNFTSIDTECFNGYERYLRGVYATNNKIEVTLPDEVLKDTLKLYTATMYVGPQKDGKEGILNLPYSREKIKEDFLKWQKNHPGEVKF